MWNSSTRTSLLASMIDYYRVRYPYLSTCRARSGLSDCACDRWRSPEWSGSGAIGEICSTIEGSMSSWRCSRKASWHSFHHRACSCSNWSRHRAHCPRGRSRWSWRRGTPNCQLNSVRSCPAHSRCSSSFLASEACSRRRRWSSRGSAAPADCTNQSDHSCWPPTTSSWICTSRHVQHFLLARRSSFDATSSLNRR